MKQTEIWREARRLYNLGVAVHWLHPRSKRPIGTGWTTGPRKTWQELRHSYVDGYNLGFRLGTPSAIGEGYLMTIDVDIKSTDKRHLKEALAALRSLIGETKCPEVRSGRGNGSRHLHCLTPAPFKTWNPAQSEEMIRVLMPSKSPSKREHAELTEAEIKAGWRISRAWEISYYSDGRQVVAPPSIHPDSGKPYVWVHPLEDVSALPLLSIGGNEGETGSAEPWAKPERSERAPQEEIAVDFVIDETLDVRGLPGISDEVRAAIVDGAGVTDRSGYLMRASHALITAGLDRNGVLSVLTDRETFLGECAYEHAQTDNRKRAAKWIWNYTLKKIMRERDPRAAFEGAEVIRPATLDEGAAAKQAEEIELDSGWKSHLEKTEKGKYKSTYFNCQTILFNTASEKLVLKRDNFAINDFFQCDTLWGAKKGAPVTDDHLRGFKKYCVNEFGIEFPIPMIDEMFKAVAAENTCHPVREYLQSLTWDGKSRLETWLQDFAGATGPDEYLKAVSRKVIVAMIKRVFEPGCKFDYVLILEGIQGTGKSTLLEKLAAPWFTDETLNIGDKDAVLTMQSKWLVELGELSALSRAEIETMKAFITRRTDRIRAPYGKRVEEYPRQCIFIGSTNQDEYLRDETGNRRFWPVKCGEKINFKGLGRARDQLFAEAYATYLLGEPVYLDQATTELIARTQQTERAHHDAWVEAIQDITEAETFPIKGFEMREVAKLMEMHGAHRLTLQDQHRIGKCLRTLGFEKFQESGARRRKLWRRIKGFTEPCGTLAEPWSKVRIKHQ